MSRTACKDQRRQALDIGGQVVPVRARWKMEPRGAEVVARLAGREEPVLTVRPLGKGRVAYLASAGFPYPDEDGMVQWLMKKLGLGPMLAVSGEARDRHLVFSLRHRERQQLVLHVSDLTTFAGGKRIEPNSSHEIDPVTPIAEVVLQLPMGTKPTAVKVVPTTTRLEWEHQNDMLRLVLRDFQQHAAVLLDTTVPERLQLLSPAASFPPPRTYETSPVILSEDFDGTPVGKFPAKPVWAANTDAKTGIHVAVDPVSPTNRVLEFVDAPDARVGFLPYAQCTWLGVVSYATVKTHFYVDNVRLERLP